MEDLLHAKEEFIENLEIRTKELTRAKRDQENIYEAEVSFQIYQPAQAAANFSFLARELLRSKKRRKCSTGRKNSTPSSTD
jgi:hypothetical protein